MAPEKPRRGLDRALSLWEAPAGAGESRVCVATTFTLDATFFETDCLGRFLQMESHPGESASVAYLVEREERLAGARVCVLVDRRHARDKESLRWDVLGVSVPHAAQHAKVAILLWHRHLRVIIGSGNLTPAGYRKNVEVFGTFDLTPEAGDAGSVGEVLDFLRRVETFAVGRADVAGPRRRVRDALVDIRRHIAGWGGDASGRTARAVPVFGGPGLSVIEAVGALWKGGPIREAYVLSPYFDADEGQLAATRTLTAMLAKKGPRSVTFDVRAEGPEGARRVRAPRRMVELAAETAHVEVRPVLANQQGEHRDLHAKMLSLNDDAHVLVMMGSSNFTTAGLGAAKAPVNLEANIVYRFRSTDREAALLDETWPDVGDAFDWKAPGNAWDPEDEAAEDGADEPPLPTAFEDAVFEAGTSPSLSITLGSSLPTKWVICAPGEGVLLSSADTGPGTHTVGWTAAGVPVVLQVEWESSTGPQVSNWPVNVANPATLPPPDVLRHLTLGQLLEILSSARPIPQAITAALEKRGDAGAGVKGWELDPLKRHDSQEFLLRRARRVAVALERLRDRLERPIVSLDAFEWRVSGPVGPAALADAFIREGQTHGEAAFCLAELALTLHRVRVNHIAEDASLRKPIRARLDLLIQDIKARANELTPSAQIAGYVQAAFEETGA